MKRNYECLLIVDNAVATEEARNALVEKFTKMAGANVKIDRWGLKKFAYPINYKKDGYYFLLNFAAEGDVIKKNG